MKAALQNLALVLVSSLIALGGIEIGLRIFGGDVLALGNQYVFYNFDPVLGWSNLPNTSGQFTRLEFTHQVDTNSLAMRDREVGPKALGEFRVAVLGDSFVWGIGAAYGERFTEVLEAANPRINALNFGVSGYAPIQYLLELDKVLAERPDFVVMAFCLTNDLGDNVASATSGYAKPYGRLSPDGAHLEIAGYPLVETKGIGRDLLGEGSPLRIVGLVKRLIAERRSESIAGGFGLDQATLYGPDATRSAAARKKLAVAYKVNELIIDRIRQKITAALGPDRFLVLLVPGKQEYSIELKPGGDPSAVANGILASLSSLAIPVLDAREVIRAEDFWAKDGHWRASGHRKVGEQLAAYLTRNVPASGPSPP